MGRTVLLYMLLLFGMTFNLTACSPDNEVPATFEKPTEQPEKPEKNPNQSENMNIKISIGDKILTATLNNTPTSQDFIARLPLTLQMSRHDDREYYAAISLSKNASTEDGYVIGDICYWAPGNCIVFYYAKGNSGSLIKMGRITSDLSIFKSLDNNIVVIIEKEK